MSTIDVNAIAVGSDLFTSADWQEVRDSLARARTIYATIGLTLGTIRFFVITVAQARGRENIDSDSEAEALTDEWTVSNKALDVFFVRTYAGATVGRSRIDGPCDKNAKGMDGSVVAIEESTSITGLVAAHEMAHYLGLSHINNTTNLMNPSVPNGGLLTASQGNNMKDHCFVF